MKHAIAVPFIMLAAGLIAAASYKPSSPALPVNPSAVKASNVEMTPDQPEAPDAGKATEEIASMRPAATAEPQDANASAVVSLPLVSGGAQVGSNQPVSLENIGFRPAPAQSTAEQMLAVSNAMRAEQHRGPLPLHPSLCAAAQEQASLLASTGYPWANHGSGHYWGNGDWFTRAQKHGFRPGHVAEVITPESFPSVDNAFAHWRGSAGHYATIIANDTSCGFGYAPGRNGMDVYVGLYGTETTAVARSETGEGSSYSKPLRTLPTAFYSSCGPNECGPAMQGQSYQGQRRRLFWRR